MADIKKIKRILSKKKKNKPKITKIPKRPKPFYCKVCDRHYTRENEIYHYDTKKHKNNLVINK